MVYSESICDSLLLTDIRKILMLGEEKKEVKEGKREGRMEGEEEKQTHSTSHRKWKMATNVPGFKVPNVFSQGSQ